MSEIIFFVPRSNDKLESRLKSSYPNLTWKFVNTKGQHWDSTKKINYLKTMKSGRYYVWLDQEIAQQCLSDKLAIDCSKIDLVDSPIVLAEGQVLVAGKKGLSRYLATKSLGLVDWLSGDKLLPDNLPKNPELLVLAVVAGKVTDYSHWIESAERLGYNYVILGQGKKWEGWGMRTREYYEYLKTCSHPYVLLSDTTDVFFNRPADELVAKFKKFGKSVVMGGERCFAYPHGGKKGRYDPEVMKRFFDQQTKAKHRYPNAGLRMGTVAGLREMLSRHLDYEDDQAPCFDDIYQGKEITIDHDNVLFGNCPGDGDETEDFYYDEELKCVRSKHSDEMPAVMHFPGRNFKLMYRYYSGITDTTIVYSEPVPWWVWLILIIIVSLFLAVAIGIYISHW